VTFVPRHRRCDGVARVFADPADRRRNLAAETHVDDPSTVRSPSSTPTSSAPSCCCRRPTEFLRGCAALDRDAFSFLHVSTDEVYGTLGPMAGSAKRRRMRPIRLRRQQGVGGSSRSRVLSYLRAAGPDHQLLQQLRPVPVSRETDPADDSERARRRPLPIYGDGGNVRDWLHVEGPLRGAAARARRDARAKSTTSAAATSAPTSTSSIACVMRSNRSSGGAQPGAEGRQLPQPQDVRTGSARARPTLRDRRDEDTDRARVGANARVRRGAGEHCALVLRAPRVVRAGTGGAIRSATSRSRLMESLLLCPN
jgi:hypothetical protein